MTMWERSWRLPFAVALAVVSPHRGVFGLTLEEVLPPEGQSMLLVGQDNENIFEHTQAMGQIPAGFSSYFSFQSAPMAVTSNAEGGAGTNNPDGLLKVYGNGIAFNLAGAMVDGEQNLANGNYDNNIRQVCDWIKASEVPVFFRPGYEFDGLWNHYDPDSFKSAFRKIVTICREQHADNVFFVWHTGSSKLFQDYPIESWYPGDDYVDLFGVSVFSQLYMDGAPHKPAKTAGDYQNIKFYDDFAILANRHSKPLMICESTPRGFQLPVDGVDAWNMWFLPFFEIIDRLDIRIVHYISDNWDVQDMWNGGSWGDSRVHANPEVKKLWEQEMAKPRWKNWLISHTPETYDPDRLDPERVSLFGGVHENSAGTDAENPARFLVDRR